MEDTRKLKATELFNHLYQACNILRGPINQDEFKACVIPILFLKRISDCYDEETAAAEAKYGADVSLYSEAIRISVGGLSPTTTCTFEEYLALPES